MMIIFPIFSVSSNNKKKHKMWTVNIHFIWDTRYIKIMLLTIARPYIHNKQYIFPGIGKFQYLLLGVSGAIYATCAVSSTTLSFVLPSAECDFNLSSADKGRLSAVPLFGKTLLQHGAT